MNQNTALLVYFSGTGGTKKIVETVEEELQKSEWDVSTFPLDLSIHDALTVESDIIKKAKYLFVLYPVYASDAPKPVYEWIKGLPLCEGKETIVISVSASGDVAQNKYSRIHCIKALEEKGCKVFYEKMLIMPSNFAFKANDDLCMWLIKSIPRKVEEIVKDVLNNKVNRLEIKKNIKEKSSAGQREQKLGKKFGLSLYANEKCTACSWCANHCPRKNIKMDNNKPQFSDQCIMCMRCIYGCPSNAIKAKKLRLAVLKKGYNLKSFEAKMKDKELRPIEKCGKGILWSGVRKYLSE